MTINCDTEQHMQFLLLKQCTVKRAEYCSWVLQCSFEVQFNDIVLQCSFATSENGHLFGPLFSKSRGLQQFTLFRKLGRIISNAKTISRPLCLKGAYGRTRGISTKNGNPLSGISGISCTIVHCGRCELVACCSSRRDMEPGGLGESGTGKQFLGPKPSSYSWKRSRLANNNMVQQRIINYQWLPIAEP